MISQIDSNKSQKELRTELIALSVSVGMVEFNNDKDIFSPPEDYEKIGNFELDILAIDKNSEEVVLLDHDQPDYVMGQVAKSLSQFINALKPIDEFIFACIQDNKLAEDEAAEMRIAKSSGEVAGGDEYQWFYRMIFGI